MILRSMRAENYRSLRSIQMDLAGVNLFVGENGVGKSNLYRALHLTQAAVRGTLAHELAAEGGMLSVLWSGTRRQWEGPARIRFEIELLDEERAITFRYRVEAGLRPSEAAAGFALEPQIKFEELSIETGRRPIVIMKRDRASIHLRGENGRMEAYPDEVLTSETAIALIGETGTSPEAAAFRRLVLNWRFYHGFRTDRASPLRHPCLAVTAPLLEEDGANLAAVFATLRHTRQDTVELDRIVASALGGAELVVPEPQETAEFGVMLPEFPKRLFQPRELSDGQIRFLGLSAALLSYRQPPFIALNEPEASLHPDMLPALAELIAAASKHSQIWVVTHSAVLAEAVQSACGVRPRRVIRNAGATTLEGLRIDGSLDDETD